MPSPRGLSPTGASAAATGCGAFPGARPPNPAAAGKSPPSFASRPLSFPGCRRGKDGSWHRKCASAAAATPLAEPGPAAASAPGNRAGGAAPGSTPGPGGPFRPLPRLGPTHFLYPLQRHGNARRKREAGGGSAERERGRGRSGRRERAPRERQGRVRERRALCVPPRLRSRGRARGSPGSVVRGCGSAGPQGLRGWA